MKKPEERRFQQKAREVWDRKLTKDAIYINYDLMTNYRLKTAVALYMFSLLVYMHLFICIYIVKPHNSDCVSEFAHSLKLICNPLKLICNLQTNIQGPLAVIWGHVYVQNGDILGTVEEHVLSWSQTRGFSFFLCHLSCYKQVFSMIFFPSSSLISLFKTGPQAQYFPMFLNARDRTGPFKKRRLGNSLVVQWLRLWASTVRDVGSIPPWQGT